jgi:hypothetical protein
MTKKVTFFIRKRVESVFFHMMFEFKATSIDRKSKVYFVCKTTRCHTRHSEIILRDDLFIFVVDIICKDRINILKYYLSYFY